VRECPGVRGGDPAGNVEGLQRLSRAGSYEKKVGSFADNLTAAVKAEYETLKKIKESLIDFGLISGLCTNVEKTTIMRTGNRDSMLDPRIPDLGFAFVDEMKVFRL
jgi:hypothetical protein